MLLPETQTSLWSALTNRLSLALAVALIAGCTSLNPGRNAAQAGPGRDGNAALSIISAWPTTPKHAAATMIAKYGPPAEATPNQLVWYNNGPWKRTVVTREETDHAFPMPHKDVMEQFVDYEVAPEKLAELAKFDGSVHVYRTRGEIAARCDLEEANFLALNLAHEINTGKRSVEEAREFYPKALMAQMERQPTEYTQKLQFSAARGTAARDKTIVSPAALLKAMKLKHEMTQQDLAKVGLSANSAASGSTGK